MKEIYLSPEQKEKLAGTCYIYETKLLSIGKSKDITKDNFRALFCDKNTNSLYELSLNDFGWLNSQQHDFYYHNNNGDLEYIVRECMPTEVVKLLDEDIEKRSKK